MADTRLYELEECVSPQADDILLIEESATQTDKKVKVSSLMPTDAVESAVADWLDAHPEATTTVEDGSITPVKLATSTMDLFDAKANTAGEYDDMTVGSAKQLLSKGYTENKTPYIYRASAGGDRVYEKLIGGTVAWNQLVQNGNFADTSNWINTSGSTLTIANNEAVCVTTANDRGLMQPFSSSSPVYKSGHIYIVVADIKCTSSSVTIRLTDNINFTYNNNVSVTSSYQKKAIINAVTSTNVGTDSQQILFLINNATGKLSIKNAICIDLTQMFGSTIADYIYSLEQSTAGAGVAYFRQMFPSDYYAYDTGSLQSVNVASKKVVGFNQIDESQIVNGSIDTNTGVVQTNANRSITGFIKINPNWTYYMNHVPMINIGIYAFFYNENQSYIGYNSNSLRNSQFTPKDLANAISGGGSFESARYVRFRIDSASYSVGDACLNISNASKNGTYEPYEEHTYTFDSDVTLRGLPKLDSNNNLYYDGDVYESDGTVTRKYGIVDLGTLTWLYNSTYKVFYCSDDLGEARKTGVTTICSKYLAVANSTDISMVQNGTCCVYSNSNVNIHRLYVKDEMYTTTSEFKTAMNGVYLIYEIATPTTESADAYINPQIVDADGTEEFVDYAQSQGTRGVAVPVGHESKYMINLRAKIEDAVMLPTLPTANGTYTLKCTVASGVPTLSWVAD